MSEIFPGAVGPEPTETTVEEVAAALARGDAFRLIDAREEWEFQAAAIPGAELLTRELANALLVGGDRNAIYVFTCHHGVRSMQAAAFFADQGFKNVRSMRGGIEEWSLKIDPTIPRY